MNCMLIARAASSELTQQMLPSGSPMDKAHAVQHHPHTNEDPTHTILAALKVEKVVVLVVADPPNRRAACRHGQPSSLNL